MAISHCTRPFRHVLLVAASLAAWPAQGVIFRVFNAPPPLVLLSIGSYGSAVDQVSFNVSASQLGSGNPVNGSPRIRVIVANRATPRFSRTAVLSVDSSTPLTNGSASVPFTEISWQSRYGDVPAGRYDGSSNQFLMSFPNSFLILDYHSFRYDNTSILAAGTYTGRVTYTLAMP